MKLNEAIQFVPENAGLSDEILAEGVINDISQINDLQSVFLQRGDDVIVMAGMKGGKVEWVRFEDGVRRERGEYPNRSAADQGIGALEYEGYTAIKRDGVLMRLLKALGNIAGAVSYIGGVVGIAIGVAAIGAGLMGAGTLGLGLLGMSVAISATVGGWWAMNVSPNVAASTRDAYGPATNPETIANQKMRRTQARDSEQLRKQTRLLRKMA